jgi:DNA-binding NarL/FixJ family response regulator
VVGWRNRSGTAYASDVPLRVLLVDDVVEVRRLVRTALRFRGGFEVAGEAGDGHEAVQLAERLQPDIVVLDLGLPDLAGREVLVGIRGKSPSSKVVVFSGTDPLSEEWIAEHVEGFVLKDAELDYLVDLLESVGRERDGQAVLELPQALASVREARQFATKMVLEWNADPLLDDVLIVVSELAANAIAHAKSSCQLRLSRTGSTLRIEVIDTGEGTPEPQPMTTTEEHGRGLHLVGALTAAWGMEVIPGGGKLVWAELPLPA